MLLLSEPKIVIHGHDDLLLGAEVTLGRLDRRMPQQKFNLFEVAARLPAELGACPAEVVGPEALDPNLLGRSLDDRPDGPVAQGTADLSDLREQPQKPAVLDSGGAHPAVDGATSRNG